jgi:hypothetical protein
MKTAMQTLISKIETEVNKGGNGAMATGFDYGLKKAKQLAEELLEMEKEQIIEAHTIGYIIGGGNGDLYNPKEYYNETFKQQEQ